jgi:hypothetical protein
MVREQIKESHELLLIQALQNIAKISEKIDNLPNKSEVDEIVEKHIKTHIALCPAAKVAKISKKLSWLVIGAIVVALTSLATSCFFN